MTGTFTDIITATEAMCNIIRELNINESLIGMEIPPTTGFYAVKLWTLDSQVYSILNPVLKYNSIWLFNVSYLRFINGKVNSKKDTVEMINKILNVFEFNGFKVEQKLLDKRGNPRKFTNNQCDSFLYCIRMLVRYGLENGLYGDIIQDIININDKFLIEKESRNGKTKKG